MIKSLPIIYSEPRDCLPCLKPGPSILIVIPTRVFLQEQKLPFPIVGKPIRGRGSHGVRVCYSKAELYDHLQSLSQDSHTTVMLEQYLSGEEATITVMPPSSKAKQGQGYWALPIVTRFNHEHGVAPYNGLVAVTANSRALTSQETERDKRYAEAAGECEAVAELLRVTAPIRIDIRRFNNAGRGGDKFALFDVNMKPVSTTRPLSPRYIA